MKLLIGLSCSLVAILGILAIVSTRNNSYPTTVGPEVNGWKVGACYQHASKNPFDDSSPIKKILDHKGGYLKYVFFRSESTFYGWGSELSDSDYFREIYTEIPCPKTIWEVINSNTINLR
jgi:hypothetical protein